MPTADYVLPLSKAEVLKEGKDVTVVGYGSMIYHIENAVKLLEKEMPGVSCEVIDLRTLLPWDVDTVVASVAKTGRLVIAQLSTKTGGFAAEIAATVLERLPSL